MARHGIVEKTQLAARHRPDRHGRDPQHRLGRQHRRSIYALTPDEVRVVHDGAIEANAGRSLLTAGVGRSLKEAIELGRRAKANGADALMAHQPLDPFAAPQSQAAYFKAIADGVDLPLVAYVRSDAMSLADILGVANHPNVAGVKFATTNLMLLSECIRASGPETGLWVCGLAEGWAAPVLRGRRKGLHVGARQCRPRALPGDSRRARGGQFRARARTRRHHRHGSRRCGRASAMAPTSRLSRKPWS